MAEIIKITSPLEVKNRIQNTPKTQAPGVIFDITQPDGIARQEVPAQRASEDDPRQELLKYLSKELHLPLMEQTKAGAESIRKLILYAKLFQVASGAISEEFLSDFFVQPKELFAELQGLDDAASVFKGDFFQAIRSLVKTDSFPELRPLILNILKAFDCYIGRIISLQAVEINIENLILDLTLDDARLVSDLLDQLQRLSFSSKASVTSNRQDATDEFDEIRSFLKNELIPMLRSMSLKYPPADRIQDSILSIIHYVVRFDKSDPQLLEKAFDDFAKELRLLFSSLSDEDMADMKNTLLGDAKLLQEEISSPDKRTYNKEGRDLASLLEKALDKDSPAKISLAGRELLQHLVQSESPMQPHLHFLIPLRFRHEDTYGEFFVDKECKKRKGDAKEAINIFFTIQSDLYGTFEVDLLAKDKFIELEIKCPTDLVKYVNDMRSSIRESVEAAGYRLSTYQVEKYEDSTSILKRFPELMSRRSSIDVKI